jgi:transposase-like protein
MPSLKYSTRRKNAALQHLHALDGNIQLASQQLGIPVRTLYAWRKEALLQQNAATNFPPEEQVKQENPIPTFEKAEDLLDWVRQQIVQELVYLVANLEQSRSFTTGPQRIKMIDQLLNRLVHFEDFLGRYRPLIKPDRSRSFLNDLLLSRQVNTTPERFPPPKIEEPSVDYVEPQIEEDHDDEDDTGYEDDFDYAEAVVLNDLLKIMGRKSS